jgi:hypothetical protein
MGMHSRYYKNIKPYVEQELADAKNAKMLSVPAAEFTHLENAHVLGQASTSLHTKVHVLMLLWAIRQANIKEGLGQTLRIIGAATKTAIGIIPSGNTGGSNVSPCKVLPVSPKLAIIIHKAKKGTLAD